MSGPGSAPVIQVNGKSYVEIESLARLTNGSVSFQANRITLTLVTSVAIPLVAQTDQPARLSKDVLQAGIEEMAVIGEWRTALVNAVQNNNPITEDGLDGYRRNADSKLAVGSNNPDVHGNRLAASDSLKFVFLQHAQQSNLSLGGKVADLVQEDRTAARCFEASQAPLHGSSERALLVTEQCREFHTLAPPGCRETRPCEIPF
jgi:hypothetical protein